MERIAVESSNILTVLYLPEVSALEIEFKSHKEGQVPPLWRYSPITPEQFAELMLPETSKGKWVDVNLKKNTAVKAERIARDEEAQEPNPDTSVPAMVFAGELVPRRLEPVRSVEI